MMAAVQLSAAGEVIMPNGAALFLPVMQFTGLLDTMGTEIYEDDILSDSHGRGIVQFSLAAAAFVVHDVGRLGLGQEGVFYLNGGAKWDDASQLTNTRVIGNVHEHPHLLRRTLGHP